ncbi:MAG: hypothetical protein PHO10_12335 [Gemmiger sp.]|nr:hypothetical protein [Gemmiger sp.]
MKDIMLFTRQDDPYCLQAKDWVRELLLLHPEYEDIPLTELDVNERPDIVARYHYTFLPVFFVGGAKLCECPLKKERVAEVFDRAWNET